MLERVGLVCAPLIDVPRRWPKERAPERDAAPWDEGARDAAARERRTREADLRHHADNVARAREAALAALARNSEDSGEQEDQWMVSGRNASAPPPPAPAIAVPAPEPAALAGSAAPQPPDAAPDAASDAARDAASDAAPDAAPVAAIVPSPFEDVMLAHGTASVAAPLADCTVVGLASGYERLTLCLLYTSPSPRD